jgi:hemolysin III
MNLVICGGVAYTVGVPFFVRNNNLDHAIWHIFVLTASIFHWCAIYFYITEL